MILYKIIISLLLSIKTTAFLSMGTFPIVPWIFLWEQFILDMFSSVLLETGFCYALLADQELTVQSGGFEHAICLSQCPECWDSHPHAQ